MIRVQSGVGKLQRLVKNSSADLQCRMEDHWVKMRHRLCILLAKRVAEAREDQIRESRGVAGLYVQN